MIGHDTPPLFALAVLTLPIVGAEVLLRALGSSAPWWTAVPIAAAAVLAAIGLLAAGRRRGEATEAVGAIGIVVVVLAAPMSLFVGCHRADRDELAALRCEPIASVRALSMAHHEPGAPPCVVLESGLERGQLGPKHHKWRGKGVASWEMVTVVADAQSPEPLAFLRTAPASAMTGSPAVGEPLYLRVADRHDAWDVTTAGFEGPAGSAKRPLYEAIAGSPEEAARRYRRFLELEFTLGAVIPALLALTLRREGGLAGRRWYWLWLGAMVAGPLVALLRFPGTPPSDAPVADAVSIGLRVALLAPALITAGFEGRRASR